MFESTANAVQTVNPNLSIVFTDIIVPCESGLVRHRSDTGIFLLSGTILNSYGQRCNCRTKSADYYVTFSANVALATGATVEPISIGFMLNGTLIGPSTMITTPAAVEEYANVSKSIVVNVWNGCCEDLSIVNLGTQPILVQNAVIDIIRPDLYVTR